MPRHRHRRADETLSGFRHVATAAAVASGALAVVTPVAGLELGPVEADLRLASETTGSTDGAGEPDHAAALAEAAAAAEAPRSAPVLGSDLVRSAGLLDATADAGRAAGAEAERIAAQAAARARTVAGRDDRPQPGEGAGRGGPDTASCDIDTSGLGAVQSWVADAAEFLGCAYGRPDLIGVAQRANASDHPTGHALDLMVRGETGDRIAECALANADELGVKYVIWDQRMNHGSGWTEMEDRGDDTANHVDHVHISFEKSAGSGDPDLGRCA